MHPPRTSSVRCMVRGMRGHTMLRKGAKIALVRDSRVPSYRKDGWEPVSPESDPTPDEKEN